MTDKAKYIQKLVTIIDGYNRVIERIRSAIAKINEAENWELPVVYGTDVALVYNTITKDIDLYKLVVGHTGHDAHAGAVEELAVLVGNPSISCPDSLQRLNDYAFIIEMDNSDYKKELIQLVSEL